MVKTRTTTAAAVKENKVNKLKLKRKQFPEKLNKFFS